MNFNEEFLKAVEKIVNTLTRFCHHVFEVLGKFTTVSRRGSNRAFILAELKTNKVTPTTVGVVGEDATTPNVVRDGLVQGITEGFTSLGRHSSGESVQIASIGASNEWVSEMMGITLTTNCRCIRRPRLLGVVSREDQTLGKKMVDDPRWKIGHVWARTVRCRTGWSNSCDGGIDAKGTSGRCLKRWVMTETGYRGGTSSSYCTGEECDAARGTVLREGRSWRWRRWNQGVVTSNSSLLIATSSPPSERECASRSGPTGTEEGAALGGVGGRIETAKI